jgi:hypothetical protein
MAGGLNVQHWASYTTPAIPWVSYVLGANSPYYLLHSNPTFLMPWRSLWYTNTDATFMTREIGDDIFFTITGGVYLVVATFTIQSKLFNSYSYVCMKQKGTNDVLCQSTGCYNSNSPKSVNSCVICQMFHAGGGKTFYWELNRSTLGNDTYAIGLNSEWGVGNSYFTLIKLSL